MVKDEKKTFLIRETQEEDIGYVALNMRPEDVIEIWSSNRVRPLDALRMGFDYSEKCYTLVYNGKPTAIFGALPNPTQKRFACIWLLATPEVEEAWMYFGRQSRAIIAMFKDLFGTLYNHVDARNKKSIAWLTWCGAKIHSAKPLGPDNLPFHYFTI